MKSIIISTILVVISVFAFTVFSQSSQNPNPGNTSFKLTPEQWKQYRNICTKFYDQILPLQKLLTEERFKLSEAIHQKSADKGIIKEMIDQIIKEIRKKEKERRTQLKEFIQTIKAGQ
jgi:DNA-directed RNA polymerase beta' subunit